MNRAITIMSYELWNVFYLNKPNENDKNVNTYAPKSFSFRADWKKKIRMDFFRDIFAFSRYVFIFHE